MAKPCVIYTSIFPPSHWILLPTHTHTHTLTHSHSHSHQTQRIILKQVLDSTSAVFNDWCSRWISKYEPKPFDLTIINGCQRYRNRFGDKEVAESSFGCVEFAMPLGHQLELLGWWVWRSDRQLKLKVLTIGGSPGRNGYTHHRSLTSTRGCLPFQEHSVCPRSGKVFKGIEPRRLFFMYLISLTCT